jgi:ParB-like chromosome segregation protein Spo0J
MEACTSGAHMPHFKRVPIESLHEDPANARRHPERNRAAVRASLAEFGQVEALVVQKGTGRVIGGNCRLGELRALGVTEVMVAEVDLHGVDAARLGLVLNRSAETAEWDQDALGDLLAVLKDDDALEGLGWDEHELADYLEAPAFDPTDDLPPDLGTIKPYKCPECEAEFTLQQLKDSQ